MDGRWFELTNEALRRAVTRSGSACALAVLIAAVGCARTPHEPEAPQSEPLAAAAQHGPVGNPSGAAAAPVHAPGRGSSAAGPPAGARRPDQAAPAMPPLEDMLLVGDSEAVAALARVAAGDPDARRREEAVSMLADRYSDGGEARRALELALIDPDREVRRSAIDGLVALGGEESARALAIVQTDEDPRLRQDAVHGLGALGGVTASGLLRQALLDQDAAVRLAAAELLELSRTQATQP